MYRTRAYRRDVRHKAICRKKAICQHNLGFDWYSVDGKYSKGKIHCGCRLCKFGKAYNLPTFKMLVEKEAYEDALMDVI